MKCSPNTGPPAERNGRKSRAQSQNLTLLSQIPTSKKNLQHRQRPDCRSAEASREPAPGPRRALQSQPPSSQRSHPLTPYWVRQHRSLTNHPRCSPFRPVPVLESSHPVALGSGSQTCFHARGTNAVPTHTPGISKEAKKELPVHFLVAIHTFRSNLEQTLPISREFKLKPYFQRKNPSTPKCQSFKFDNKKSLSTYSSELSGTLPDLEWKRTPTKRGFRLLTPKPRSGRPGLRSPEQRPGRPARAERSDAQKTHNRDPRGHGRRRGLHRPAAPTR